MVELKEVLVGGGEAKFKGNNNNNSSGAKKQNSSAVYLRPNLHKEQVKLI
jgi:hypothetical protein